MIKIVCKDFQTAEIIIRDYLNYGDYYTFNNLNKVVLKNKHFCNIIENPEIPITDYQLYGWTDINSWKITPISLLGFKDDYECEVQFVNPKKIFKIDDNECIVPIKN